MANSILAKMAVQITAQNADFARAMQKSQRDLSSFVGGVKNLARTLGVAFSVQQIADFTLHVSRLAGEAEAVRAAFERLPESTKLMSELKRATGGTVSELDLMKRAVQANNFEISLEALPRLLEFATLRAQQTGQSVDYLVDSIVTGIGRKSKLILDNLGISAVQLNEALGGASTAASTIGEVADAVGRIAEANLKNMEGFAENAATKMQRLAASWTDLKVAMGDAANSNGILGRSLNGITNAFNALSGDEFTRGLNQLLANGGRASEVLERFAAAGGKIDLSWQELLERGFIKTEAAAKKYEKILAQIAETQKNLALAKVEIDPATGLPIGGGKPWDPSMAEKHIVSLDTLREKEKELVAVFNATDEADKARLETRSAEILSIRAQIKALEDLLKVEEDRHKLSITAQRAIKDEGLKKVSTFGDLITKTTPFGGVLQNFEGVAGETTPFAAQIPVDIKNMEALAEKMVEVRNASFLATTEMKQHWVDFSGIVTGAVSSLAEGLGGAVVGVEDFGSAVLNAFVDFAKQFGQMLIASGFAALALEKLIVNPVAAIGAGVALVALAGAASGALSKAHGGLSGGGGGSAPGRVPSQIGIKVGGRIRGYDLALVNDKESYRRSRMG